jgi:uncharacterized protein (DUF2345 family)
MVSNFKGDGQTKRKETPPTWQEPDNPNKSGFQYPNYTIWHTRSGHAVLRVDDTKGSESVSVEGRGGTGIHFLTNNGMKLVANYGRIDITYGQHRSVVTGAQDQTVRGESSLRTEGKRRETNNSDFESVTNGKSVTAVAGSVSMTVGEGFNLAAEETTIKTDKGITLEASGGPAAISGKGGVSITSKESSVLLVSETKSAGISAANKATVKGKETHLSTTGGARIVLKGGNVYINSDEMATDPIEIEYPLP